MLLQTTSLLINYNATMKLLPYENFYLTTNLPPNIVIEKLKEKTELESFSLFRKNKSSTKQYEGFVASNNFQLKRIIQYRNSFLPIITGEIKSNYIGTGIHVKMKMYPFVYIFMAFWLGFVTIAGITVVTFMLREQKFHPGIFGVLIMFVGGYGLTLGSFKYESTKSKKFLIELLQATITMNN